MFPSNLNEILGKQNSPVIKCLMSSKYSTCMLFLGEACAVYMYHFSPIAFHIVAQICFVFLFSAWGESLFMSVQTCLMVVMYFYYTSRPLPGIVFPILYSGICYVLVSGLTPMSFLVQFVSLNVVFLVISRVSIVP